MFVGKMGSSSNPTHLYKEQKKYIDVNPPYNIYLNSIFFALTRDYPRIIRAGVILILSCCASISFPSPNLAPLHTTDQPRLLD